MRRLNTLDDYVRDFDHSGIKLPNLIECGHAVSSRTSLTQ